MSARLGKFFEKYDLLLTPIISVPTWPIGLPGTYIKEVDGKPVNRYGWHLNPLFNLTGQPAASVPAGFTEDGFPVGLQIVAQPYDEATVFRAAAALEQANPWAQRKPPID